MKRRTIFIELTSLLDVILIMIFVILTQARGQTAAALDNAEAERLNAIRLEEALTVARSDAETYRNKADSLSRQLIADNLVLDHSMVITVSCAKDGTILLESNGSEKALISYNWEDDNASANRLRALLLEELQTAGDDAVFIVFQYDRGEIYHTEHLMIEQVIQTVKLEAKQKDMQLSFLEFDRNGL